MASTIELLLLASLSGPGTPVFAQTDPTAYSPGNVTSAAAITKSWGMLPGAPQAGQVYGIATEFTGTWQSEPLAFQVAVAGAWTQMNPSIGASAFAGAAVIAGWLALTVRVLSATTGRFALAGAIGAVSSAVTPGTETIGLAPLSQTLTIAASDTIALGYLFGSSAAGQGLQTYGSTFTRMA
jgi:hypothetical protein